MGKVTTATTETHTTTQAGGVLDINTITRQPTAPARPKSSAETIAGTIERIVTMPSMQPLIEQGARLMGAYAEKIMLENAGAQQKGQQNNTPQQGRKPVFGVGSDQP